VDTFDQWTLSAIRAEGAPMSWFEEQRFEWTPVISSALKQIVAGKTVILITDYDRKWFANYILTSINKLSLERPLIPVSYIDDLFPHYQNINLPDTVDTLIDMLELSYKGEYFFWYIGRGEDARADLAKRSLNSLLWIMDENFQNALKLRSFDPLIDIKLLQLYKLFDKTLSSTLFGEVNVRE
jgi:hypothetical protein